MTVGLDELRAIDFFDGVEDDRLAEWAAAARERWCEPGELVVSRGAANTAFKLLLAGSLDGYVIRDEREERDHTHVAPTWLGALMAVTDEPAPITIRAAERSRVADIEPATFRGLLFRTPVAFQRVMRTFRPIYSRFGTAEMQREKLAALGQMSAGLAHELNNPAAAATRTAASLADALDVLGGVIGEFVDSGVERADAGALVALQRQATVGATEERNALASADPEDEMGALLEARGVPDA